MMSYMSSGADDFGFSNTIDWDYELAQIANETIFPTPGDRDYYWRKGGPRSYKAQESHDWTGGLSKQGSNHQQAVSSSGAVPWGAHFEDPEDPLDFKTNPPKPPTPEETFDYETNPARRKRLRQRAARAAELEKKLAMIKTTRRVKQEPVDDPMPGPDPVWAPTAPEAESVEQSKYSERVAKYFRPLSESFHPGETVAPFKPSSIIPKKQPMQQQPGREAKKPALTENPEQVALLKKSSGKDITKYFEGVNKVDEQSQNGEFGFDFDMEAEWTVAEEQPQKPARPVQPAQSEAKSFRSFDDIFAPNQTRPFPNGQGKQGGTAAAADPSTKAQEEGTKVPCFYLTAGVDLAKVKRDTLAQRRDAQIAAKYGGSAEKDAAEEATNEGMPDAPRPEDVLEEPIADISKGIETSSISDVSPKSTPSKKTGSGKKKFVRFDEFVGAGKPAQSKDASNSSPTWASVSRSPSTTPTKVTAMVPKVPQQASKPAHFPKLQPSAASWPTLSHAAQATAQKEAVQSPPQPKSQPSESSWPTLSRSAQVPVQRHAKRLSDPFAPAKMEEAPQPVSTPAAPEEDDGYGKWAAVPIDPSEWGQGPSEANFEPEEKTMVPMRTKAPRKRFPKHSSCKEKAKETLIDWKETGPSEPSAEKVTTRDRDDAFDSQAYHRAEIPASSAPVKALNKGFRSLRIVSSPERVGENNEVGKQNVVNKSLPTVISKGSRTDKAAESYVLSTDQDGSDKATAGLEAIEGESPCTIIPESDEHDDMTTPNGQALPLPGQVSKQDVVPNLASTSQSSFSAKGFMCLPPELRNMVYDHVIGPKPGKYEIVQLEVKNASWLAPANRATARASLIMTGESPDDWDFNAKIEARQAHLEFLRQRNGCANKTVVLPFSLSAWRYREDIRDLTQDDLARMTRRERRCAPHWLRFDKKRTFGHAALLSEMRRERLRPLIVSNQVFEFRQELEPLTPAGRIAACRITNGIHRGLASMGLVNKRISEEFISLLYSRLELSFSRAAPIFRFFGEPGTIASTGLLRPGGSAALNLRALSLRHLHEVRGDDKLLWYGSMDAEIQWRKAADAADATFGRSCAAIARACPNIERLDVTIDVREPDDAVRSSAELEFPPADIWREFADVWAMERAKWFVPLKAFRGFGGCNAGNNEGLRTGRSLKDVTITYQPDPTKYTCTWTPRRPLEAAFARLLLVGPTRLQEEYDSGAHDWFLCACGYATFQRWATLGPLTEHGTWEMPDGQREED